MSDILQRVADERDIFKKLLAKIPGFKGYIERGDRRMSDKLLREQIANEFESLYQRVSSLQRDLINQGLASRESVEGAITFGETEERFVQVHGTLLIDPQGKSIGAVVVLNRPATTTTPPRSQPMADQRDGASENAPASAWVRVNSAVQSQAAAPIVQASKLPQRVVALPAAVGRSTAAVQSPMQAEWRALATDIRHAAQAFLQATPSNAGDAPDDTGGSTSQHTAPPSSSV